MEARQHYPHIVSRDILQPVDKDLAVLFGFFCEFEGPDCDKLVVFIFEEFVPEEDDEKVFELARGSQEGLESWLQYEVVKCFILH